MNHRLSLLALLLLNACVGSNTRAAPRPAAPGGSRAIRYTVHADEALSTLDVRVCFDGFVPPGLSAGAIATMGYLESATFGDTPLPRSGRVIDTRSLRSGDCMRYVIDVDRVVGTGFTHGAVRSEDVLFVSSVAWLFMPSPIRDDVRYELAFEGPEGMHMSTAWERMGEDHFVLDERVFEFLSHTVFGRFARRRFDVDGIPVEIARLPGELTASDEDLEAWATGAIRVVASVGGRFPAPRAQLVMVPVDRDRDRAVAFGFVGRGGGASVLLLPTSDATLEELEKDWVLVHELSHLLHPYVSGEDAWLGEGLATYYQEVLRARSGVRTPLEAWRAIDDGFRRGRTRGTGRSLREESAAMHRTGAFWYVYWGGTAIWLMIDVELRSHGSSLDAVLRGLADCCSREARVFSADEVIREVVRISGDQEIARIVSGALEGQEFPDVDPVLESLGLVRNARGLVEIGDGPKAAIRDAITRPTARD